MFVRDLEGNEYPLQATITYEKELNGNQSISFRVLPSKVNTFIHDISEMWEVVADTDYKIIYCKKKGTGDELFVEVRAIPTFFDDFNTQRIYEEYNEHMTANLCFNRIFQNSGYNFILNGTFQAIQWEGFGAGDTRLELFKRALNRYKAEFRMEDNTIYLENLIGRDTQFQYRYKLNASNIVQENDASAYWTYAKGYGDFPEGEWQNAKLIREYTSPLAEIIGKREAPPIKNGSITTNATMDEQLQQLVDESLKISVTADIHDLKHYPLAQPQVGDRAFLIDERIGLETEIRINHLRITKDWQGNVIDIQATFGSPNIVKRHQSNLQTAISNITQLLEGKIKLPFSVLDNAVAEATKALQRMESQLTITDNGSLMAVDTTDPNNVVVFNAAGLGVSDDGGATFGNAITGRGINANYIYTGTMLADRIAGGILQSLNGNTEWNLNTGELTMQSANFTLGGGARINFTSVGNRIQYRSTDEGLTRSSGMGVGRALSGFPFAYLGTTGASNLDTLNSYWSGLIVNTTRAISDGESNSITGFRFQFRNAVPYDKGYEIDLTGNVPYFRPINAHLYDYSLGVENNRWNEGYIRTIYGTLAGTSTHNAKTNIEDVDGQQAFDYFDMMKIKSFYYKDEDYTNPFNRKVSPIIEQLDPTLENLYKATDDALDINSNLWLLARAFKHFAKQTNERLELLENGTIE